MSTCLTHRSAWAVAIASGLAVALTSCASAPTIPDTPQASDPRPFNTAWRTVLRGTAAKELVDKARGARPPLLPGFLYRGGIPGLLVASWDITGADMDALEQALLRPLAEELRRANAGSTPDQYYRQYAAAEFKGAPAILVNGVHIRHFSRNKKDADSWTDTPVLVTSGGDDYWCAVYFKTTATFMLMNYEGPHKSLLFGPVLFHSP